MKVVGNLLLLILCQILLQNTIEYFVTLYSVINATVSPLLIAFCYPVSMYINRGSRNNVA